MISELPFFMQPQFLFMICTYLYLTGFMLCAVLSNKLIFNTKKIEKSNVNLAIWLVFSMAWFLVGFYLLFVLTYSLFREPSKKDQS